MRIAEVVAAVATGRRTARSFVTAAAAAASAQTLNAFTAVEGDSAADGADAVDGAVAAGDDPGALAGVPVALKDIIDHAGRVTTCGSSFLRDKAASTATVVDRLERAGAVIVGRTGLHEFAYGFSSENEWWGPVRNPWDPATSPGGSSGGSAAAVAAGIVPLAIGTDTGGSVRVPAALCGCCGLKVTHGRIPLTGVFPLAPSLDTVGPIATCVADLIAAYLVMAGEDPSDPWSAPRPVTSPGPAARLAGLRVGVPTPWAERPLDDPVAAGFATALDRLAAAGVRVSRVAAPALDPSRLPRASYAEVAAVHRAWFTEDPGRYGPSVRHRLAADMSHTPDAITAAAAWRAGLRHAAARVFAAVDVLATPTVAVSRKVIGARTGGGPRRSRAVSTCAVVVHGTRQPDGGARPGTADRGEWLPPALSPGDRSLVGGSPPARNRPRPRGSRNHRHDRHSLRARGNRSRVQSGFDLLQTET